MQPCNMKPSICNRHRRKMRPAPFITPCTTHREPLEHAACGIAALPYCSLQHGAMLQCCNAAWSIATCSRSMQHAAPRYMCAAHAAAPTLRTAVSLRFDAWTKIPDPRALKCAEGAMHRSLQPAGPRPGSRPAARTFYVACYPLSVAACKKEVGPSGRNLDLALLPLD